MENYDYINWYFKHFYYYNITMREYLHRKEILWIDTTIQILNNDNKSKILYNNILRKQKLEKLEKESFNIIKMKTKKYKNL